MKNILLLVVLIALTTSCDKEQQRLIGKWELIAVKIGTGGLDEFKSVDGHATLEFFDDGIFVASEPLCSDDASIAGIFTETMLNAHGCDPILAYEINGQYFDVYGTNCIEECSSRYRKANMPWDLFE
jgi:hypothetical protein